MGVVKVGPVEVQGLKGAMQGSRWRGQWMCQS